MIALAHGNYTAKIAPLGAELQSLLHVPSNTEYIWQADPQFWGKHSPVLFPIVGSLRNNEYFYNGVGYSLSRHGFARDQVFEAEQLSTNEAIFTLAATADTKAVYPFDFQLQLLYTLDEQGLRCMYRVYNPAATTLYFSIGGHPAFRVPLREDRLYTDYQLQFNHTEPLARYQLEGGLIAHNTTPLAAESGRLALSPSLFYSDAIVLKGLQSTQVALQTRAGETIWTFDFSGFTSLGIWAAKDAPFLCIEPWCGHADAIDHGQDFTQKADIERLAGGESWERSWSVSFPR